MCVLYIYVYIYYVYIICIYIYNYALMVNLDLRSESWQLFAACVDSFLHIFLRYQLQKLSKSSRTSKSSWCQRVSSPNFSSGSAVLAATGGARILSSVSQAQHHHAHLATTHPLGVFMKGSHRHNGGAPRLLSRFITPFNYGYNMLTSWNCYNKFTTINPIETSELWL